MKPGKEEMNKGIDIKIVLVGD